MFQELFDRPLTKSDVMEFLENARDCPLSSFDKILLDVVDRPIWGAEYTSQGRKKRGSDRVLVPQRHLTDRDVRVIVEEKAVNCPDPIYRRKCQVLLKQLLAEEAGESS